MMSRAIPDPELVALYVAESKLPALVVTAFVANDTEPPSRDRVDRVGYTAAEARMIAPFLTALDPVEV